ncbi:MAG: hypothetical protein AAF996_13255 [Pseudomonadota bacterium]
MLRLSPRLIGLFAIGSATFSAHASEVDFCKEGEGGCLKAWVENQSSALVTSVDITEQYGADTCNGGLKLTQESNMVGGGGLSEGASFAILLRKACRYKFKFKTTSGCTGDKVQHLEPEDFADEYNVVKLTKACGTLDAKKSRNKTDYG